MFLVVANGDKERATDRRAVPATPIDKRDAGSCITRMYSYVSGGNDVFLGFTAVYDSTQLAMEST